MWESGTPVALVTGMRLLSSRLSVVAALALAVGGGLGVGCSQEDDGSVQEPLVLLSAPDQLLRASMALRGVRPSVEDMQRVAADPVARRPRRILVAVVVAVVVLDAAVDRHRADGGGDLEQSEAQR